MRNWKCIENVEMHGSGDITFTKGKIYEEKGIRYFGKQHTGEPWTDVSLVNDQGHDHSMDLLEDMPRYFEYIIEEEIEAMAQLALKLSNQLTHNRPRSRLYDIKLMLDRRISKMLLELPDEED